MAAVCSYYPNKGKDTFFKLKNDYGYNLAWNIWGIAASSDFQKIYENSIKLDKDKIPTYESIMNNEYIRTYIKENVQRDVIEKRFLKRSDTLENYNTAVSEAIEYNKNGEANNRFVAIVERDGENIQIKLVDSNEENRQLTANQAGAHRLNQRLADILSPVGVTYNMLSEEETKAGRVGVTDFSVVKKMATDSLSIIRVANNMEGAEALGEEFCHVIVRAMKDNPLLNRVRNLLKNNEEILQEVLGEDYDDIVDFNDGDMDLVVEEALGQLLQDNLLRRTINEELPSPSLMSRAFKSIRDKFKHISTKKINDAIIEADNIMDDLAKDILDTTSELNQSIKKTKALDLQMDAQFNALSKSAKRNIEFLKKYSEIKMKEYKIKGEKYKKKSALRTKLSYFLEFNEETSEEKIMEGIVYAIQQTINDFSTAAVSLRNFDLIKPEDRFKKLNEIRQKLQAYGGIIKMLSDIVMDETDEKNEEDLPPRFNEIKDMVRDLKNLSDELSNRFMKKALPTFGEFMKNYITDDVIELSKKKMGKQDLTIEDILLTADNDISFLDYFLDAMAHSSNLMLQGFGRAVDKAKSDARLATIPVIKRIQALRKEALSMGITSFEWMFERYSDGKKTGSYISEVNQGEFNRDLEEEDKYLNEKYGEIPKNMEELKKKQAERSLWLQSHSEGFTSRTSLGRKEFIASKTEYHNDAYDELTEDQKYILDKFLEIKNELDALYPTYKIKDSKYELRAIQMRKNGVQRFIDVSKSPDTIISNIWENLKSEFVRQEDDINEFGEKNTLTDFDGKELMKLPILYVNKLKNPDDLSTDVFSTLMAHAAAANEFDKMSDIIDALELGRNLVTDNLKVKKKAGSLRYRERVRALGLETVNDVYEQRGTNIEKKLNRFMDSQVYHRFLADQGTVGKVDVNKATSFLIKMATNAQLAFNILANLANITNGICMTNIEVAAGQYFTWRELLNADRLYASELAVVLKEIASTSKTSKLELFGELFNVKNGYDKVKSTSQRNSFLARIFGKNLLFIGQELGDHWLYNRTAIAMALHTQVNVPGEGTMSLWDAVNIEEAVDGSGILKATLPEGITYEDGKAFDVGEWSKKLWDVNSKLFGVYNSDDMYIAKQFAIGRLVMLYRNWIKPQFNKRFQKGIINTITGEWEEGYYRTALTFVRDLYKSGFKIASEWDNLDDNQKANVRRAAFEIAQIFVLWGLVNINWGDDKKKRPWLIKLARYLAQRTYHETAVFVPSGVMFDEAAKTFKSPTPVIRTIMDVRTLWRSMLTPEDWTTEVQSGKFKGWTKLQRAAYKAPIPALNQWRQMDRFVGDLDLTTDFLARPYNGY